MERGRGGRRRGGRGRLGDGPLRVEESVLDAETRKYLEDVKSHLTRLLSREEGEDEDETDPADGDESGIVVLVRNVVKELLPRISNVVRDPFGSRIFEELVDNAPAEIVISELAPALLVGGPHKVAKAAEHRCSSHVMEKVIARVGAVATDQAMTVLLSLMEDFRPPCLLDVVRDPRASHVLRVTVWNVLGSPQLEDRPKTGILDEKGTGWRIPSVPLVQVSKEAKEAIGLLSERLIDYGDKINEIIYETQPSAVLQCLLRALTVVNPVLATKMLQSIVGSEYEHVGDLCSDHAASRFMEVVVAVMGDSEFNEMYQKALRGYLMAMARDSKANYVLQRWILRAGELSSPLLLTVLDELEEGLGTLIDVGRAGVVLALCRACANAKDESCAKRISRLVARAVGAVGADARELIPLLLFPTKARVLRWRTGLKQAKEDNAEYTGPTVATLGALLCQSQLRLPREFSKIAEDSISSLARNEILWLAENGSGSRVIDSFLEGPANAAVKSRVIATLKGEVSSLAKNVFAGRVVEKAYAHGTAGERKWIVEELASALEELREDPQAKFTLQRCRVEEFVGRREAWLEKENVRESKKRVYDDLLQTVENFGSTKSQSHGVKKKPRKESKRTAGEEGVDSAMASLGFGKTRGREETKEKEDLQDAEDSIGKARKSSRSEKKDGRKTKSKDKKSKDKKLKKSKKGKRAESD